MLARACFTPGRQIGWWKLALLLGLCFSQAVANAQGQKVIAEEQDYASELPRFPAKSPSEALASFNVLPGYHLELVAAEPLIADPVAFAFDAAGRLFVAEMKDYSEQADEFLGSIALLEDTDHDGVMDRRSDFATGLSWPTAVWPWRDGVLVAAPPNITWYRDTDGDGKSDEKEIWFSGFGRNNVQGMANSFRWGLDGFLHGATSSAGAKVVAKIKPSAKLSLRRRDFRIDPVSQTIEASTGGGQHGLSFNRWGDKFVTSNSDHLQQILDLERWIELHSSAFRFPSLRRSIAADGPQAEVFRASPVEPWRIVRTRLRVGGVVPGPVEGGGRAAGYFTGATGTLVMDHEAGYSAESGLDTALVCDVGSNLVHRKHLIDEGIFWQGVRSDSRTELVTSTDTWFRPVQLGDGPDGRVYIADMYREVIEHPKSLPPMIKKHLNLTSGRDRGRIWRLVADGVPVDSARPNLSELDTDGLVAELESPIRWRRQMASQLLVESLSGAAGAETQRTLVVGSLSKLLHKKSRPEAVLQALYLGARLDSLSAADLHAVLAIGNPRLTERAIRIAREQGLASEISDALLELVGDRAEPRVLLEVALAAADLVDTDRLKILQKLLPIAKNEYVRSATAVSAGDQLWRLVKKSALLLSSAEFEIWLNLGLPHWKDQLLRDKGLVQWITGGLSGSGVANLRASWVNAVSKLRDASDQRLILELLSPQATAELEAFVLEQADASGLATVDSFRNVGLLDTKRRGAIIEFLLEPTRPWEYQQLGVALATARDSIDHDLLIANLSNLTPKLQVEAVRQLAAGAAGVGSLLSGLEAGDLNAVLVPQEVRERILSSASGDRVERARNLFGQVAEDRAAIVEQYSEYLDTIDFDAEQAQAAAKRGQKHFERVCSQCHRMGGQGNDVGARLKDLGAKAPRQLLISILDPNREIDPKYISYTVLLDSGKVLTGVIQDETADRLVMRSAGGIIESIDRKEISQMRSQGVSLMPEGLEQQVTPEQLVDLLYFLRS